jgi:N-glycosylase/DNA lyase
VESGYVEVEGALDLQATLESGQSYVWERADGRMYDDADAGGWYCTTVEGEPLRVRQRDHGVEWRATVPLDDAVRRRLGLDDDLETILASAPDDDLLAAALDAHRGLRIVRDPFFPCLVSFICSAQMRVERIHEMQMALRREYGEAVEFDGHTHHTFPAPTTLAATTEADLRDLGLGYRAPYVVETARMVADEEVTREDVAGLPYEKARAALTEFVGVGEKVADCVLLFSLGYLEAIPLDTWIRSAIEEHFPECARGNYRDTSRAVRERFGGEYAGYVQTYVFHHLRE